MKNSIVGLPATTLIVLLSGISGFFILFVDGISTLMHYIPSAALTVASGLSAINFALANGCCVCIPIPLVFGVFTLFRRANAAPFAEPLSQPRADI